MSKGSNEMDAKRPTAPKRSETCAAARTPFVMNGVMMVVLPFSAAISMYGLVGNGIIDSDLVGIREIQRQMVIDGVQQYKDELDAEERALSDTLELVARADALADTKVAGHQALTSILLSSRGLITAREFLNARQKPLEQQLWSEPRSAMHSATLR